MMGAHKEKNNLLVEWDRQTAAGTASSDDWMSQFLLIKCNYFKCSIAYQFVHTLTLSYAQGSLGWLCTLLVQITSSFFYLVTSCHTTRSWLLQVTSMESVPFETGIKSMSLLLQRRKTKGRAPNQNENFWVLTSFMTQSFAQLLESSLTHVIANASTLTRQTMGWFVFRGCSIVSESWSRSRLQRLR
jgi:hypothetical protein